MTARQQRLLPWLALFTIYVVWGSTYLAIAVVVKQMPPFAAASIRFLAAGAAMAALAAWVDREHGLPSRRQWLEYSVIGVLFLGFGNGIVMWSEQRVPSGIAALVVATVPLWTTLLDGLRPGGQEWTLRGWLAAGIGLGGVFLIARPDTHSSAGHLAGVIALQVAAVSWTCGALYSQSVAKKLPVFTASAVEMIAGSAVLLVESLLLGEDLGRLATASAAAWGGLGYLVVFGSLIGFTAFAYCLSVMPAGTVATYAYVNPVVAVALGALLLREPLSAGLLSGGLLILVAVVLATARPRKPAPPPKLASPEPETELCDAA